MDKKVFGDDAGLAAAAPGTCPVPPTALGARRSTVGFGVVASLVSVHFAVPRIWLGRGGALSTGLHRAKRVGVWA